MFTGGEVRDDAAIRRMEGDLRRDHARADENTFRGLFDYGGGSIVTGSFEGENMHSIRTLARVKENDKAKKKTGSPMVEDSLCVYDPLESSEPGAEVPERTAVSVWRPVIVPEYEDGKEWYD
jgi:hypothetical protein